MKNRNNTIIALGTLTTMMLGTMAGMGTQPAEARGFIRRHPLLTAAGGYMVYHHYHKKHVRQQRKAAYNHNRSR